MTGKGENLQARGIDRHWREQWCECQHRYADKPESSMTQSLRKLRRGLVSFALLGVGGLLVFLLMMVIA